MMGNKALVYFGLLFLTKACLSYVLYQPEQIHISFGENVDEMILTWNTGDDTYLSRVEYGIDTSFPYTADGDRVKFVDGGSEKRVFFVHKVTLKGLEPGQVYLYRVGSEYAWSEIFFFRSMKNGTDWSPSFILLGDMGNVNAMALPFLQREAQAATHDAAIHVGDFAYNMETDNAEVGDEFMRQIQPIAAYLPYMTCVGNHESAYNFSNYKARFNMPRDDEKNMFYSFDMGPIHFISISTEYYYYLDYGLEQIPRQFNWLVKDLIEANHPANRTIRPWIIVYGHKPMYCSTIDEDDCALNTTRTRVGMPIVQKWGMEELFYNFGVDLQYYGHEHNYERLWPIYNQTVYNGSYEEPYTNPGAPVHIVTGSAGCYSRDDYFEMNPPDWSAFRSLDYSYSRMNVFNATHLYFEQYSVFRKEIIDSMWIIKDYHGPYQFSNKSRYF